MKETILVVTSPSFSKNELLRDTLSKLPVKSFFNTDAKQFDPISLSNYLKEKNAEVLIVGLEKIDEIILKNNPQLKLISKYGVGLDNIDSSITDKYNVKVGFSKGVNKNSVVELVLAFSLGHTRNVFNSQTLLNNGVWKKNGGKELVNCKFGIIGLGNIGTLLARKLKALGLTEIYYHDIIAKSKEEVELGLINSSHEHILSTCDIISYHVPLDNSTKYYLNKNNISLLKSNTLIINTARGEIIDFEACCNAVIQQKIGGLACDVFPFEPYDITKFKNIPNLYFTPHIGGNSVEAVINMGMASIQHVKEYLENSKYL